MSQFKNLVEEINSILTGTSIYVTDNPNKLANMQALAAATGNPEKRLKIIHVAGTSGKTSTCYIAAALLTSVGLKTGLTVSPHIDSVRERAIIDLNLLPEADWVTHMTEFFALVKNSSVKPSYFEFYLGFAFWLFAKLQVDYVVLETGLGGTWDGSNIATRPDKIALITDIGLDHTEILGDTLAAIATEKAGIIHPNNPVFMHRQKPEVTAIIKARAIAQNSSLHLVPDTPTSTKNFMTRNFALAKAAVDFALQRDGKNPLTSAQIKQAQAQIIPSRAEAVLYKNKQIIMDGSHNPQKIQVFTTYLNQKYPATHRTLLATLGSNKTASLAANMQALRHISDHLILTSFKNESLETNKRASIPEPDLLAAAKQAHFKSVTYIHDPRQALAAALKTPAPQVVITGSFYLLQHLRPALLSNN